MSGTGKQYFQESVCKKSKSFWFHYNKQQSKQLNRNILTIHWEGKCHFVESIDCRVPVKTRSRKTQPRCVLAGRGVVVITDKQAVIS